MNAILRPVFDVLLYPFRGLPPLVGLTVVSLVTAIGMLLMFRVTSNQTRLADVKRRIHACLFEIRLFNDDLRAILRAQLEILRWNGSYLRLSLVPMVWILPPLVLVVAQLQFHYGYRGLEPGSSVLLEVELDPAWHETVPGAPERPPLTVEAPAGLRVEAPAVWVPTLREMTWRLTAERQGDYNVAVHLGDTTAEKTVSVTNGVTRRSPLRSGRGLWDQLLYPAESPLPAGAPITAIHLAYPEATILGQHWLVPFFILSIIFAFALRNRLGVTI